MLDRSRKIYEQLDDFYHYDTFHIDAINQSSAFTVYEKHLKMLKDTI